MVLDCIGCTLKQIHGTGSAVPGPDDPLARAEPPASRGRGKFSTKMQFRRNGCNCDTVAGGSGNPLNIRHDVAARYQSDAAAWMAGPEIRCDFFERQEFYAIVRGHVRVQPLQHEQDLRPA